MKTRDFLILRLEGPLMSFGGPKVDQISATQFFPGASFLTGLLANAMGWSHGEGDRLNALQSSLHFASRLDCPGRRITDYHTVDLGRNFMVKTGWTTRGIREDRAGANSEGTLIRNCEYLVDACVSVALELKGAEESVTLEVLEKSLRRPARPLFLGRKSCLPSSYLLQGRKKAHNLVSALESLEVRHGAKGDLKFQAEWPAEEEGPSGDGAKREKREVFRSDLRDWKNQVHVGQRRVLQGLLKVSEEVFPHA